jgi:hypothetical protein
VLHQTISAIQPQTWEAVNRAVLASAKQDKLEKRRHGADRQHSHCGIMRPKRDPGGGGALVSIKAGIVGEEPRTLQRHKGDYLDRRPEG